MEAIPLKIDNDALNDGVLKTITRLMSDPKTAHLASPVQKALDDLNASETTLKKAWRHRVIADTKVQIGQEAIVQDISLMELDAQRVVQRKIALAPYKDLFGTYSVGAHRQMEPEDLEKEVQSKIKVIKELPQDSILRPHVQSLTHLLKEWEPPRKEFTSVDSHYDAAAKDRDEKFEALDKLLFSTHGDVEKVYPGDLDKVESFFVRWTPPKKRKAKKTEEPPADGQK